MPLIACPDCSHEISTRATSCPHCGCPINPGETPVPAKDASATTPSCPDFPSDLSLGDLGWGAPKFKGYFSSQENTLPGIMDCEVTVFLRQRGIWIIRGIPKLVAEIHKSQIINMQYVNRAILIEKSRSVIKRAVVGQLLLGPVAAIVGGMSGLTKKTIQYEGYFVLNYWDVNTRTPQSLLIAGDESEIQPFCQRANKELGVATKETTKRALEPSTSAVSSSQFQLLIEDAGGPEIRKKLAMRLAPFFPGKSPEQIARDFTAPYRVPRSLSKEAAETLETKWRDLGIKIRVVPEE